jgi:aryl-alcohol dehydrogenase-like predicted oxidoreductase
MLNKLTLGTVQFGMKYGIANRTGQVSRETARTIMELARHGGIDMLDTAISYGDSEQSLGDIGVADWNVITKLPLVPDGCGDVGKWVQEQLDASLQRLRVSSVETLLLHHSRQLPGPYGKELVRAMRDAQDRGLVRKIGVSVYHPDELDAIDMAAFQAVQAPFNVLDKNLLTSGWLERLREMDVEVQVRSVFLQGLLLMEPAARPQKFQRWDALWDAWDHWLESSHLTPLQACLQYVMSVEAIDRIVIGVETPEQLSEILAVQASDGLSLPSGIDSTDIDLIHPSRW